MFTAVIFIFILSVLIIVHEFGHFIVAKKIGVRVERFSLGFGPVLFSRKRKDTEYSISAVPLGGFVKLAGDSLEEYKGNSDEYYTKSPGERFQIIVFGPLLNYVLGFLFLWLIFFMGYPTLTARVGGLLDGFGAKEAGLEVGDKITAVDGKKVIFWEELQRAIQDKKESSRVQLSIARGGKEYAVEVSIKEKQIDDSLGQKRKVGLLGITPFDEVVKVKYGMGQSFILGLKKTWDLTAMTYKGLWRLLRGKLSMRESMTGPLGIFYITSKVASMGLTAVLHLMAVLSVSLAIFNLLPLPVLDGGHILLLGIEKLRGRTLNLKAERLIAQAGMALIISLAVFVTYNDILRLFGDKISKFLSK